MCDGYDPTKAAASYFKSQWRLFLDQTQFVDFKTWLQDDILVKADRMSMANSVEVRCLLLDHRLVNFAPDCQVGQSLVECEKSFYVMSSTVDYPIPSFKGVNPDPTRRPPETLAKQSRFCERTSAFARIMHWILRKKM